MYVCMYVCMHACMYVRTYVCMYVCMYVWHVVAWVGWVHPLYQVVPGGGRVGSWQPRQYVVLIVSWYSYR